jgi:hypothetical protein
MFVFVKKFKFFYFKLCFIFLNPDIKNKISKIYFKTTIKLEKQPPDPLHYITKKSQENKNWSCSFVNEHDP